MFGDLQAKVTGVRHVWINYLGTIPDDLTLYQPYQNRECLYCHGEARFFNEDGLHGEMRPEFDSNEISCLECHTLVHDVGQLDTRGGPRFSDRLLRWSPDPRGGIWNATKETELPG